MERIRASDIWRPCHDPVPELQARRRHPFDTLLGLFDAVPTIRALKDWSNDAMPHERHIRTFQNLPRPVNVLTTHSAWLMASLTMGANGLLSGAGSVIADLQVALFRAVKSGDLKAPQFVCRHFWPMGDMVTQDNRATTREIDTQVER